MGAIRKLAEKTTVFGAVGSTPQKEMLPSPMSHIARRGYHIDLGAREKALLEEDPALKRFKSYKNNLKRISKIGDVLSIVVVAACAYELYAVTTGSATKHNNAITKEKTFEDLLGKLRIMESRRITQKILQVEALRRKDGHKRLESPALGRSIFSFAGGRKSIPSKWDEAERWLVSSHCHQFPAQVTRSSDPITYDQQPNVDAFAKKLRARQLNAGTETIQGNTSSKSKCQTPAELSSPARHDTPSRAINHSSNVKNYQFSKHDFGTHFDPIVPHWSLEEENMSWCFKHYDVSCGRKSFAETGAFGDEERTKSHNRYRREEAKIQAWVRLENVKAEAQASKLEVKIQRMRYDLEVKLMKKMAAANRRAEEWRELARKQLCKNSLRSSNQEVKIKQQYDSKLVKHSSCCGFSKTSNS